MISVILYGRNDNYGYNLHKRATLSLNCIAEILTHNDDEILFVDYNSKDDFPTFPEAVGDLLTEKCKKLLRIIRVREAHHKEASQKAKEKGKARAKRDPGRGPLWADWGIARDNSEAVRLHSAKCH